MAKVEMTGFEYMEMADKVRELDTLKHNMVDALKVSVTKDEDSISVRVTYELAYPKDVLETIKNNVAEQLAKDEEAVYYLYQDGSPCLVASSGYFTRDWGNARDINTVDLRENENFKRVWDKITKENEEEE